MDLNSDKANFVDMHMPATVAPALTELVLANIMLAPDSEQLDWLPDLPKLRRLVLTELKTQSSQLPRGIVACSGLTELQLEAVLVNFRNTVDPFLNWPEYRLRTLSAVSAGPYLSHLVSLSLTRNAFKAVPPAVAAATALQHLILGEQISFKKSKYRVWKAGPVRGLHVLNSLTCLKSVIFRHDIDAQAEAAIHRYQSANPSVRVSYEPSRQFNPWRRRSRG